jgi:hypothetical protein
LRTELRIRWTGHNNVVDLLDMKSLETLCEQLPLVYEKYSISSRFTTFKFGVRGYVLHRHAVHT